MCKVFLLSNIKESTRNKALALIKEMGERMSISNTDGLGYAALDETDNLFGERWLNNKMAFKKEVVSPFGEQVKFKPFEYSSFGNINLNNISSIALHTRFATCEKSLRNVHPFVKDEVALIHNGVVRNPEVYAPTISTCDSESLLNGYLEYEIMNNPEEIETMLEPLEGYWVTALYSKLNGKYIMDIIKYGASLDVLYIYELEAWVFSTNGYDVEAACDKLRLKYGERGEVNTETHIRLDPQTGEVLFTNKYEKKEKRSYTKTYYPTYEDKSWRGTKSYNEIKKEKTEPVVTVYNNKTFSEFLLKRKHNA